MEFENDDTDSIKKLSPQSSMENGSNCGDLSQDENSISGPAFVLLWIWNWLANLPKAVTNFFADIKNGELLSKFTMLDAMLQFIFAVATSCHPQEDPEMDDPKVNSDKDKDIKVFEGAGRTLRSRTVTADS